MPRNYKVRNKFGSLLNFCEVIVKLTGAAGESEMWERAERERKRGGERRGRGSDARRQTCRVQPVPSQVQEHTRAQWPHEASWWIL